MTWLRKAKEWVVSKVTNLFRKEEPKDVAVAEKQAGTLENVARRVLALGPTDLSDRVTKRVPSLAPKPSCVHDYFILRQKWIKVAAKKFELRNEMCCSLCKDTAIKSIE